MDAVLVGVTMFGADRVVGLMEARLLLDSGHAPAEAPSSVLELQRSTAASRRRCTIRITSHHVAARLCARPAGVWAVPECGPDLLDPSASVRCLRDMLANGVADTSVSGCPARCEPGVQRAALVLVGRRPASGARTAVQQPLRMRCAFWCRPCGRCAV